MDPLDASSFLVRQRGPHPSPEDGSELGHRGERNSVINPEHMPIRHRKQVSALPVGVVDDGIEDRHSTQPRIRIHDHGHDVRGGVRMDPLLDHALAERAFTQDRRRNQPPARRLGNEEGGNFAAGKGPVRKVEQRPLGDRGLVDRVERFGQILMMDEDNQRLVG